MPFYTPRKIESKFYTRIYTQPQPSPLIKLEPQPILPEVPIEPLPEPEPEPEPEPVPEVPIEALPESEPTEEK
jgi:hypothetical protein